MTVIKIIRKREKNQPLKKILGSKPLAPSQKREFSAEDDVIMELNEDGTTSTGGTWQSVGEAGE